jgi:enoyl-CoA hydratase/carnithine racemase
MTDDRDQTIRVELRDGVAEVVLNRPDKMNAMDLPMFDALAEAGERLARTPGLRAVILCGAGATFCAGLDTGQMAALAGRLDTLRQDLLQPPAGRADNRFQRPCTVWSEVPVPVIAAIRGVAFGAGLQLALGADLRIAAPDARLSVMEARWGLIPDMGLTRALPRLMRADQALELMLSARVVDAAEAVALGLVTRLAEDPLAEARALAGRLAGVSPQVLAGAKRLVAAAWGERPEALRLEAELQAAIIGSPNQIEAVTARLSGRAPRFD